MSLTIEFDFRAVGEELPDAFLDDYELQLMFDSTRRSLGDSLERDFRDVLCGEHNEAPMFKVTGIYDREKEEMDLQYHVDTCCRYFLLHVMQILNQRS
ncbi:MAG: hypothetical protein OXG78_13700 [Chloroflexi bacterium]|nr:hypothetical protein [Chloroflexota bacterium]